MKAFLAAILFMVVVSVGADFALNEAGFSAEEVFKTENVRLPDPEDADQN